MSDTSEYPVLFLSKNSDLANGLNEGDIIFITRTRSVKKIEYIEDQGDESLVETGYTHSE
jgi:hypothetical protein